MARVTSIERHQHPPHSSADSDPPAPLTLARDVLMFSMFSMLAMQLFCTLPHASRMYSQKLRCPSELNQLPDPDPRVKQGIETSPSHNSPFCKHATMATAVCVSPQILASVRIT